MADEENQEEGKEEKDSGGGLKALLIPVVASALTAAIVGFVVVFLFAPEPPPAPVVPPPGQEAAAQGDSSEPITTSSAGMETKKKHTGHYHEYDSFVVSIFDREKVHYLRLKVSLELANPAVSEELVAKDPQIRDSMLFVLGDFTVRELLDNQAKLLVKEVLIKTLNKILGRGKVVDVYFTEFVVQ